MVSVPTVKVLVLCGLFILTAIIGMIPVIIYSYIRRKSSRNTTFTLHLKHKRIISLLSCFAAGVFLATCLLDLLPDVRGNLSDALTSLKVETDFPVAEFVMVFGLFLILVVEQIVLTVKESNANNIKRIEGGNNHLSDDVRTPLLGDNGGKIATYGDDEFDIHNSYQRQRVYHEGSVHCPQHDVGNEFTRSLSEASEHSISGISDQPCPSIEFHEHCDMETDHQHSTFRSLLLLVAISLHSVFEGLAVGLQTSIGEIIGLTSALMLHKGILCFSLSMNLIQSKLSNGAMIRSVILFALSTPLGIGIGIGITDFWNSESSNLVQGILQGIACGTFLYITFFEVLPHELNCPDIRLPKVVFILLGFALFTGSIFLHKD